MLQKEIEKRLDDIKSSLECKVLKSIQLVLNESGISVEEIRTKYEASIPILDDLKEKVYIEFKSLNKHNFNSVNYNMNSGELYSLLEQISYVKKILVGGTANK